MIRTVINPPRSEWEALCARNTPADADIERAVAAIIDDVASRGDLPGAIARMLDYDGPYMLNVNIDPADMVMPMTPVGQAVDYIMTNPNDVYNPDQQ